MVRTSALVAVSILITLAAPPRAHADQVQIQPVMSFRDMTVIVSVLDGETSDSQGGPITSKTQGSYDEEWDLSVALPTAVAQGQAVQVSEIGPSGLHAEATLASSANAVFDGAASVIATNQYQVTFTTTGPAQFALQGSLTAYQEAAGTFTFFGGDIDLTFEATNDSIPFDESGLLPAGSYVLLAVIEGSVNVNLPEVETREAMASFAFDFSVCAVTPAERRSWGEVKDAYREESRSADVRD